MVPWNNTQISIDFRTQDIADRTMNLHIHCQNQIWSFDPLPCGLLIWNAEINLPSRVIMTFGGKGQYDTQVDDNGNILQDMSVCINDIRLDGLSCWHHWPELSIILEKENSDEIILGRNITANGSVDLWFQESNALFWLVKSKLE